MDSKVKEREVKKHAGKKKKKNHPITYVKSTTTS